MSPTHSGTWKMRATILIPLETIVFSIPNMYNPVIWWQRWLLCGVILICKNCSVQLCLCYSTFRQQPYLKVQPVKSPGFYTWCTHQGYDDYSLSDLHISPDNIQCRHTGTWSTACRNVPLIKWLKLNSISSFWGLSDDYYTFMVRI